MPGFLAPCVGLKPPKGSYSHISGIDLVQARDGTWYVLETCVLPQTHKTLVGYRARRFSLSGAPCVLTATHSSRFEEIRRGEELWRLL